MVQAISASVGGYDQMSARVGPRKAHGQNAERSDAPSLGVRDARSIQQCLLSGTVSGLQRYLVSHGGVDESQVAMQGFVRPTGQEGYTDCELTATMFNSHRQTVLLRWTHV